MNVGDDAKSGRAYVLGWLSLLALTGLSFGSSRLPLGGMATAVVLGFAATKVLVVALVFMHLGRSRPTLQAVAVTSVLFVLLLVFGVAGDVMLR
jgi:caa(3)-type oxidase subunit IV